MFVREDWELFRSIESLSHKAGVPREKIAALVAKELVDNALDAGESCDIGILGDDGFYVHDHGPGIDPSQVADLFSIRRPLRSTKLLRLPSRGALGNGLRVVAGAVLATDGKLIVSTGGQTLKLTPRPDGTTITEVIGEYNGEGMRVEVHLGKDAGPIDLDWANRAKIFSSHGEHYKGKTSPWWYTSRDFHELCLAAKGMTVRDLVSQFEGCSGKAGPITEGFKGRQAADLARENAKFLLARMRSESSPVKAERLGYFGDVEEIHVVLTNYTKVPGAFELTSDGESIEIPYVVEAWTTLSDQAEIYVHVNRTPITGDVQIFHSKADLILFGCSLEHKFAVGKRPAKVWLNIITPYMPITTDGKSPDLAHLLNGIREATTKSINKAKRNSPKAPSQRSQKDIVIEHISDGIRLASGGRKHQYSLRQLYYSIRPFVLSELGMELTYDNFSTIITDYENALGKDLPGIYRDNRGILYHPHLGQDIPLGTRTVEGYNRPKWNFNKILYCEKEGFFEILKDVKWPERHDCALLTSKGYATRAARDLLDMLGDTEEDITFFCVHDADASGTVIYQSLQGATAARPERRVKVVNLGLEPSEALEMGLGIEKLEKLGNNKKRSVARYIEPHWAEWLQHNRIELNAMSTPQFLEWLDKKMALYGNGKLIPPDRVLADELHEDVRNVLKGRITEEVLQSQDIEGKIQRAYDKIKPNLDGTAESLAGIVSGEFETKPAQSWRDPIKQIADEIAQK